MLLFFQAWGFLTSLKSQIRNPQLTVPPGGLMLGIFTPRKSPSTSAGFEPANLGSRDEHVTPRPSRPTSNTLSLHSFLNVRDHVSQPYSTTGNITALYILILKFIERSLEDCLDWIITRISCCKYKFDHKWFLYYITIILVNFFVLI